MIYFANQILCELRFDTFVDSKLFPSLILKYSNTDLDLLHKPIIMVSKHLQNDRPVGNKSSFKL